MKKIIRYSAALLMLFAFFLLMPGKKAAAYGQIPVTYVPTIKTAGGSSYKIEGYAIEAPSLDSTPYVLQPKSYTGLKLSGAYATFYRQGGGTSSSNYSFKDGKITLNSIPEGTARIQVDVYYSIESIPYKIDYVVLDYSSGKEYALQGSKTGTLKVGETLHLNKIDFDGCTYDHATAQVLHTDSRGASYYGLMDADFTKNLSLSTDSETYRIDAKLYYTQEETRYTLYAFDNDNLSKRLDTIRMTGKIGEDFTFRLPDFEGYEVKFAEAYTTYIDGRPEGFKKFGNATCKEGFVTVKGDSTAAIVELDVFYVKNPNKAIPGSISSLYVTDEKSYPSDSSCSILSTPQFLEVFAGKTLHLNVPAPISGYEFMGFSVQGEKYDGTDFFVLSPDASKLSGGWDYAVPSNAKSLDAAALFRKPVPETTAAETTAAETTAAETTAAETTAAETTAVETTAAETTAAETTAAETTAAETTAAETTAAETTAAETTAAETTKAETTKAQTEAETTKAGNQDSDDNEKSGVGRGILIGVCSVLLILVILMIGIRIGKRRK